MFLLQTSSTAILLIVILIPSTQSVPDCPIGFQLINIGKENKTLCYRLKDPETFSDKFEDCAGNLYSSSLYHIFEETRTLRVWSEHRSLYPGGPYVDWSYTNVTGNIFTDSFNVETSEANLENDTCLVINEQGGFVAVGCNERYHRYCVVEPYTLNITSNGCAELPNKYLRFYSPRSTCLSRLTGIGTLNWWQAKSKCNDANGSLLNRGWRYANNAILHPTEPKYIAVDTYLNTCYPLEVIERNNELYRSQAAVEEMKESTPVWKTTSLRGEADVGILCVVPAARWETTYDSAMFIDVICEHPVYVNNTSLNLSIYDDIITIHGSDSIVNSHIRCYTDSGTSTLIRVDVQMMTKPGYDGEKFYMKPDGNGYYWCIYTDSINSRVTESPKILFLENDVSSLYAVKVNFKNAGKLTFEMLITNLHSWQETLKSCIFNNTKNQVLLDNQDAINVVLKRIYKTTLLFHVEWDRDLDVIMEVDCPFEIISVKPAYYCKETTKIKIDRNIFPHGIPLGKSVTNKYGEFKCVGDFNEGVYWENQDLYLVQEVTEDLRRLIREDSGSVNIDNVTHVFKKVDRLLETKRDVKIPGQILHMIDEVATKVDLHGESETKILKNNIAMYIADPKPDKSPKGFRVAMAEDDTLRNDSSHFIFDDIALYIKDQHSEMVVELPKSVVGSGKRTSFVVFQNDNAFEETGNNLNYVVNGQVLSITIENTTKFENGEFIDIYLRPANALKQNETKTCKFWKFSENMTGHWSSDGCEFIPAKEHDGMDICRCNHLTHFAEVLIPRIVFTPTDEETLKIISILGCIISLLGLTIIGLTGLIFRSWRKDFINKIWLQLCVAITLLVACFLIIVFISFEENILFCTALGVVLHYSVLASFTWMLVAAVISYYRLVVVFDVDTSHKLLKASVFAWGAPVLIIASLLLAAPQSYAGRYEGKVPSGNFCYPSGLNLYLSVYAPICVIILVNLILFVIIVRSIFGNKTPAKTSGGIRDHFKFAKASLVLVFLFGLPWIFGLFAYNVVGAYLFTITATFQGFILFVFFVLMNKKTRDLWLNMLKYRKLENLSLSPVTYSTLTHKSPSVNDLNRCKPRAILSSNNVFS